MQSKYLKSILSLFLLFPFWIIIFTPLSSCNKDYTDDYGQTKSSLPQFLGSIKKFKENNSNIQNTELETRTSYIASFIYTMSNPSLDYLKSLGLSEQEIYAELGTTDEATLVFAAEVVASVEIALYDGFIPTMFLHQEDFVFNELSKSLLGSVYGQSNTIGGCLEEAAGIGLLGEIAGVGLSRYLKEKGVKKVIRKAAGKIIPGIGWGLAAYDFADCLGWF